MLQTSLGGFFFSFSLFSLLFLSLSLSHSPDNRHLATCSLDNHVFVWDTVTKFFSSFYFQTLFLAHFLWFFCIVFFCLFSRNLVAKLSGHSGFVKGVAWDPQNSLIASSSDDRTFVQFDFFANFFPSTSLFLLLEFIFLSLFSFPPLFS